MPYKPTLTEVDTAGNLNHLVDKTIGNAYSVVREVYKNLPFLKFLADRVDGVSPIEFRDNAELERVEWKYMADQPDDWKVLITYTSLTALAQQYKEETLVLRNEVSDLKDATQVLHDDTSDIKEATQSLADLVQMLVDQINGVYYGALSEDPLLDPLGEPSSLGDYYYNDGSVNPALKGLRVFNADGEWEQIFADAHSVIYRTQTVESALDDLNSKVVVYADTYNTTGVTAVALAAGLGDGATVIVDRDETRGGVEARYTVVASLPVFVNELDAGQIKFSPTGGVDRSVDAKLADLRQSMADHGITASKTSPTAIYDKLVAGVNFVIPEIIVTLRSVAAQWAAGNKYPIAFFGDSTTDGRVSTTNGVNEVTLYNLRHLVGGNVPDGLVYDHDDTESPNAYPNILQRISREFFGNSSLRVYNAGFRQQRLDNGWAGLNIHNAVFANTTYSDAKWVAINFGINDSESSSGETLRLNTYRRTKALILDCYLRGVQPALVGTNPTASTANNEADYGHNEEQAAIIDQVKRQLCEEFGIEYIDVPKIINDFMAKNTTPYSSGYLLPDKFHGNDIYHLKQAEGIFAKYIAKDLVAHLDGYQAIDASMVTSRCSLSNASISTTAYDHGYNQQRERIFFTTTTYDAADGSTLVDLFVWNEHPKLSCVYVGQASSGSTPSSISDVTKLPQLEAEARLFTALDFHKRDIYDGAVPGLVGGASTAFRPDQRYWLGVLDYGLNRLRISLPAGAAAARPSWYTTGNLIIGSFEFVPYHANSMPKTAIFTDNSTNQTLGGWKNALQNYGAMHVYNEAPVTTDYLRVIPSEDRLGFNSYGLRKVGDYVEWQMLFNAPADGWGVILSSFKVDNRLLSIGSGFNKFNDAMIGSSFVAYLASGTFRLFAQTAAGGISLNVINTAVATSAVQNKIIRLRMALTAIGEITFTLYGDDGSQLWTGTTTDADFIREFASGIVGGIWANRTITTTGNMLLNMLNVREVYA